MQSGVVTVSDSRQQANGDKTAPPSDSGQQANDVKMGRPIGGGTLVAVAVGLFGIGLYAGIQGRAHFTTTASVALMVALACLMVGGGFGFLFGIPHAGQASLSEDGHRRHNFVPTPTWRKSPTG